MAEADAKGRRRRALLVANGTYGDPGLSRLRAPTGDVNAFEEVLADPAIGRFETDKLVNAGTDVVKERIEAFFGDAGLRDLLLLYISGHGVLQGDRLYFATRSTRLDLIRATSVEDTFVHDVVKQSRARTVVLVLDCCHSGAFAEGLAPKSDLTVSMERRFEGHGRVTLTASTGLEYAFEEREDDTRVKRLDVEAPGSLFTQCLVEGLRTGDADTDSDGEISVDELYEYVYKRVRERSGRQTPSLTGDRRGDILIATSSRRRDLPSDVLDAIEHPYPDVRGGAVAILARLATAGDRQTADAAQGALRRLAEDDSRTVAEAARAALASLGTAPPAPPPPPRRLRLWPPRRRPVAIAGLAAAALGGILAAVLLTSGSAAAPFDFNHDGREALAMSSLGAGAVQGAGFVQVYQDVSDAGPLQIGEGSVGLTNPRPGDGFGSALASGDFDGDGNADLAIGARGRNLVSVVYGTSSGLSTGRHSQLRPPVGPRGRAVFAYGHALAAADFNIDGYWDLAVGAPGPHERGAGAVRIVFGGPHGLGQAGGTWLQPPSGDEPGFGDRLAVGDVNADRRPDILEGAPDRSSGGQFTGHGSFCRGTPRGPASCEELAGGGTSSIAVTNVNGDHFPDVVQGDSADPSTPTSGEVRVWLGGARGPGHPLTIHESDLGLPGVTSKPGDGFGAIVDTGRLDDDRFGDIAVSAAGPAKRGVVFLIRGARFGYSRDGNALIPSANATVPGAAPGAGFGSTFALVHLTAPDQLDLVAVLQGLVTKAAKAVPVQSLDGTVVVLPDVGAVLRGRTVHGVKLAGLAGTTARKGRIRLARPPGD